MVNDARKRVVAGDGNYADRVLRCAEQLNAIRDSLKDPT